MVALFPDGDDETIVVSKLLYTQSLAEWLAVFFGRLDTADGEGNHFAAGRGRTQFMNPRIAFSPQAAITTPYVMNGVGLLVMTPNLFMDRPGSVSVLFADPGFDSDESGLDDDFFEDQYVAVEARFPTRFLDLPGSQNVVFNWNSEEFIRLGDLSGIGTPGFGLGTEDDAWSLSHNFHQYLWVRDGEDTETQGYDANAPPLRGFGVFGRFGYADAETNPTEFSFVLGLSGRGILELRPDDTAGLAGYVSILSNDLDLPGVRLEDETWGIEAYYRVSVTPWWHLTPNLQVLGPLVESEDTALLVGLRTKIDF